MLRADAPVFVPLESYWPWLPESWNLEVTLVSLAGEVLIKLRVPPATTIAHLKEMVGRALPGRQPVQQLALEGMTTILHDVDTLEASALSSVCTVQVIYGLSLDVCYCFSGEERSSITDLDVSVVVAPGSLDRQAIGSWARYLGLGTQAEADDEKS